MGSIPSTATTKYEIRCKIEVNGVVETPDIVGALFGQTEGLHFLSGDMKGQSAKI